MRLRGEWEGPAVQQRPRKRKGPAPTASSQRAHMCVVLEIDENRHHSRRRRKTEDRRQNRRAIAPPCLVCAITRGMGRLRVARTETQNGQEVWVTCWRLEWRPKYGVTTLAYGSPFEAAVGDVVAYATGSHLACRMALQVSTSHDTRQAAPDRRIDGAEQSNRWRTRRSGVALLRRLCRQPPVAPSARVTEQRILPKNGAEVREEKFLGTDPAQLDLSPRPLAAAISPSPPPRRGGRAALSVDLCARTRWRSCRTKPKRKRREPPPRPHAMARRAGGCAGGFLLPLLLLAGGPLTSDPRTSRNA